MSAPNAAHAPATSVIVAGARTPIGRLLGAFTDVPAVSLGATAISAALSRAGIGGAAVDYTIMGQVIGAGTGQITARQAAAAAGIPMTIPAITINKVCLSGMNAVIMADQMIRCGDAEIVVAGGMESMTRAPHLLLGSRIGMKYGDWTMVDATAHDALTCGFDHIGMGEATERDNSRHPSLSREAQDAFSAQSHQRAAAAQAAGLFDAEIAPVSIPQRKGELVVVSQDEGIRPDTTAESLSALRPAFAKDGTITAGSSSQISDGACAMVIMSKAKAESLGLTWIAEIGAHGMVSGPDTSLHVQPANAIAAACAREGVSTADIDLFEINEAFAAVSLASMDALGVDDSQVNVNGGAIALGHPVGMSGARIVLHLALELQRRGGGIGAAGLCGGGGQGDALILRAPQAG